MTPSRPGRVQGEDDAGRFAADTPCTEALLAQSDVLGFDPEIVGSADGVTVAFTHCPFRELAESDPDLVCGLHEGMVEGFVDRLGGAEVTDFRNLSDRRPCQVDLAESLGMTGPSGPTRVGAARHERSPISSTTPPVHCAEHRPSGGPTMITLTDNAAGKVKELITAEGDESLALRVAVRPGGCSGFSYEMFFDTDVAADDQTADYDGVKVVVDASSVMLLEGRHARLQGRPAGRRLRHREPQRPEHLRLRLELLLDQGRPGRSAHPRSSAAALRSARPARPAVPRRRRGCRAGR